MSDLIITNQRKPEVYFRNPTYPGPLNDSSNSYKPSVADSYVSNTGLALDTGLNSFQYYVGHRAAQRASSIGGFLNKLDFLDTYRPMARYAAKAAPFVNIGFGMYDANRANKVDNANSDPYRSEFTKSVLGTAGSIALGAAAGTTLLATGVALAPALLLTFGAGLTGTAIGHEVGNGIVWARKRGWLW